MSVDEYLSPMGSGGAATSIQNAKGDSGGAEGLMMERMLRNRTIQLFGGVDQKLAKKVIGQLFMLEADDPKKPITVVQNSPGGSVNDGFAIYDAMRFVKPEIRIVCVGLTASIATITLLGAEKKNRFTLPNTRFLIHQPLIPGNVFGPASDLEITAQEILKTRDKINELLSEQTGQPLKRVAKDAQRDYWMDAETALDYGLVSKILTHRDELT